MIKILQITIHIIAKTQRFTHIKKLFFSEWYFSFLRMFNKIELDNYS